MEISEFNPAQSQEVIGLFSDVFVDAEGEAEGRLIGSLVAELIDTTDKDDLIGFVASLDNRLTGAIFFSRFTLPTDKVAFLLSPVAVATECQGRGVGQQLIRFGLGQLQSRGVELALTYGDPNYYGKVGFQPLSENVIKAPLKLSFPHGWLAQALDGSEIEAVAGETCCVRALDDQQYW
ncbi:GNAT family N-acetyltransferase [Marinobacterium jannaschii]|uniref:GNAT family N-acetyltransferase n=1 Tax=Marinobacterium jannaschii TaxID=64970 RepID=UPI0004896534|nr:N-acetyltransferase [Marinobacterium jannaschii]